MATFPNGQYAAGVTPARASGLPHDDQQMDQIRDLLFGPVRAELLARIGALEQRVAALEKAVAEARVEDQSRRQAAFDGLSGAVASLATEIRSLAKS